MLAAGAFESDMSAVEELKLLKPQVSDLARVCNAVARGDLWSWFKSEMSSIPWFIDSFSSPWLRLKKVTR